MNFWIILKVALRSLRRTLLRSSLTTLGIIIGVAAVIAMVSLGNGARARIEKAFASMDSNIISFQAVPQLTAVDPDQRSGGMTAQMSPGDALTIADYRAVMREVRGIAAGSVTVEVGAGGDIRANGRGATARVQGVDVGDFALHPRRVLAGTLFGDADVHSAANVCVISEKAAKDLFVGRRALGRTLRISGIPFVVIGIVAERDQSMMGPPMSDVLLPYTSVQRRLDRAAMPIIVLKAANPLDLGRIQRDVKDLLERRRGTRKANFVSGSVADALRSFKESSATMTLLLSAIGGISLLVGGIGIMNIMLVSVTERTREIGIRLAIGTRGRDVLRQFLIEAVILSVFGGTIGILLGIGTAQVITQLNDWPTLITPDSVAAAFLCSAAIGVLFGWYPARQAARLDPIEALRAE